MITLELTLEQLEKISDILRGHEDLGPTGYGWQSDELSSLSGYIDDALDQAKTAKEPK